MRLEFVRIEEANDLVNQLIEHHPQAIFVTDNEFKVRFYNRSFHTLTQTDKSDILGREFCEIMGCTQKQKLIPKNEQLCSHCQLRELVSGDISEMELIRDFSIHNKIETKHLHIDSHRVEVKKNKYRLVVIDDRTLKH